MANLDDLTRDELNAEAEAVGVTNPASYGTKAELIEAIMAQGGVADNGDTASAAAGPVSRLDETVAGGRYLVNGKTVNANGEPIAGKKGD